MATPLTDPRALDAYLTGVVAHQEVMMHIQGWTIEDCGLVKRVIIQNETILSTVTHIAISGIDSLPCFEILATVIGYVSGKKLESVSLSFTDRVDFMVSNEKRDDLKGLKNLFYQTENLQTLDLANGNWNARTLEDLRRHLHESDECVNKLSTVTCLKLKMIMSDDVVAILEDFIQSCDSLVTLVLDAGADRDVCASVSLLLCDLYTNGYLRHLGKQQLKLENGHYCHDTMVELEDHFAEVLNVTGNVVEKEENGNEDGAEENVNVDAGEVIAWTYAEENTQNLYLDYGI
jgi:hypothetical protein